MKRLATLVGCNYPNNPKYNLQGCINDVHDMKTLLTSRFGFAESDIQLLTDEPSSVLKPTADNIMEKLNEMIDQAADGDVLFFHFSGRGTRPTKPNDVDQFYEAIVPCDLNLITDVDICELVDRVPSGATFTFFADSSHSGGLIDKEKMQIGPSHEPSITETSNAAAHNKPRFMPLEAIVEYLKSITGIESSDIGTLSCAAFGDRASIKFRPQAVLLERSNRLGQETPDVGILLSACQADELAGERDVGGTKYGVFSNAVQTVFKWHKLPVTNRELVTEARKILEQEGYTHQHPCLYCSDDNADNAFLFQP